MMSAVQKSLIAETIHGARASLHEPSRPYTPGDLPRHLFQGDDYANRPGSSYKMNNVVGQAVDEFQSAAKRLTSQGGLSKDSHATLSTTTSKPTAKKGESYDSSEQVLSILQRAETMPRKQPFRPNLNPIIGKGGAVRVQQSMGVQPSKAPSAGTASEAAASQTKIKLAKGGQTGSTQKLKVKLAQPAAAKQAPTADSKEADNASLT